MDLATVVQDSSSRVTEQSDACIEQIYDDARS